MSTFRSSTNTKKTHYSNNEREPEISGSFFFIRGNSDYFLYGSIAVRTRKRR